MNERFVLIGAGSAMFTRGLVADLIRRNQPCELGLVDTDPEALAVAEGLTKKMIAAGRAPITLSAGVDRRDILPGATSVICTIGVGGRRAWEQDVFIPRKYGIYQPCGRQRDAGRHLARTTHDPGDGGDCAGCARAGADRAVLQLRQPDGAGLPARCAKPPAPR